MKKHRYGRWKLYDWVTAPLPHRLSGWLDSKIAGDGLFVSLLPLNGQTARLEVAREIVQHCAIEHIVETGTYTGSSTLWFAQFGVPVTTAEIDSRRCWWARNRLAACANVDVRLSDSLAMLSELASDPQLRDRPAFFYLDAHWRDYLPLRDELAIVFENFSRSVAIIDDFRVPGDAGYRFDSYGPDKELTLDYLNGFKSEPFALYFPVVPSNFETGHKRGWVTIAKNPDIVRVLDGLPLLRRWRES